jgi:hypothetical protein
MKGFIKSIDMEVINRKLKIESEEKKEKELTLYGEMLKYLDELNVRFDPVLVSLIELDSGNKYMYEKHLNKIDLLEFEFDTSYPNPTTTYKQWRYYEYLIS